jgi:hypothetical protein
LAAIWRVKVALISDSYPGRKDGNYSIIFGDEVMGSLISAIHATSIRMGNELEQIITELANVIDTAHIDAFFNKTLKPGVYIIPKKTMGDRRLKFDQKPDVLVVNVNKNTCKIIEIKLGDNFDTKKSRGEVDNLKRYADKLDKATTYRVSYCICMWYAKDKTAVVHGFKSMITEAEALTGAEFCQMVGINYSDINSRIATHQHINRQFVFDKIISIRNGYLNRKL